MNDPPNTSLETLDEPNLSADSVLGDLSRRKLISQFRLVQLDQPGAEHYVSGGQRTVIGTHRSADLMLTDRTVSRFHCVIHLSQGRPVITDQDSTNGTLVDGVSIMRSYLHDGAIIKLGRARLRFEIGSEKTSVVLHDQMNFGVMVGASETTRATFAMLSAAAAADATVLLEGDTGTGKEAAARSIHSESARVDGPFIVVDCGAIPPNLMESELFGHEKGAFTGADETREGAFEAASGGTIFLDEIGELPTELQPKLLRVLERKRVRRVGSNTYREVDVRVIAATNRNLRAAVNAKQFRSDLYYRLAVLQIELMPLRQRIDDIPFLVERLLAEIDSGHKADWEFFRSRDFLTHLARHTWPGNVRELRNYLERCVVLQEQVPFVPEGQAEAEGADTPESVFDTTGLFKDARESALRKFERAYLTAALERADGVISAAAQAAGVDRTYFYRLLRRHGLK